MRNPEAISKTVEQSFDRIHRESMQGIPILNRKINVQTVGFQTWQGRTVGIVITPWLMTVIMLPADDEDWSNLELGRKKKHDFPSQTYKFMVNEFDGIGFCQTHSLHSPMNMFYSQEHAVSAAEEFIEKMMSDSNPSGEDPVNEELLGRIMRGEETPEVNLDDFATIEPHEDSIPVRIASGMKKPDKKKFDRRALLSGRFHGGD